MIGTYVNSTTSGTTPATVIDSSAAGDELRVIKKILIGAPASGATLTLFNENNALANNTTQIAFAMTLPSFSATNTNGVTPIIVDFTTNSNAQQSTSSDGLQVRGGGSISISSAMQVTVIWDYANT